MPKKSSKHHALVRPTASAATCSQTRTLSLHRTEQESSEALEQDLLSYDVDEDIESLVPMPISIPARTRAEISHLIGRRFTYAEDLDNWLHAPNRQLDNVSPFECIVAGEGTSVLRALADGVHPAAIAELLDLAKPLKSHLKLVR